MLSDTKCLANRTKRTLNHSFAGVLADSNFLEDEGDSSEPGDHSLGRPSSFSVIKAQNLGIFSSEEKRLNRESVSFFCDADASDNESKKQKQPNKKSWKVGEKESQSYILDPKKVA